MPQVAHSEDRRTTCWKRGNKPTQTHRTQTQGRTNGKETPSNRVSREGLRCHNKAAKICPKWHKQHLTP